MSWQLLTAISVTSLSVSILLQRTLLHKDKIDPYAYVVIFQGIVGVLLTIFALIHGFGVPGLAAVWLPALISIVGFGTGHIVYAKTLQIVEASVFSVLFATQAVWIMILGILLFHEHLSALQIVGSLLIFGGVGLVVKNIRSLKLDRGMLLGLLTGLIFGVAITCWSYVGRHTEGLSWAALSFLLTALIAFMIRPQSARQMGPILSGTLLPKLILLGVFYGVGSLAMLYAYKEGTFTIVSPLRQTSIVLTTLLALLFITSERNRIWRKLIAACICFAGVVLIVA